MLKYRNSYSHSQCIFLYSLIYWHEAGKVKETLSHHLSSHPSTVSELTALQVNPTSANVFWKSNKHNVFPQIRDMLFLIPPHPPHTSQVSPHSTNSPLGCQSYQHSVRRASVNMGGIVWPLMSASKVLKWECLPLKIRQEKAAQLKDAFGSAVRHTQCLWLQGILLRTSFISPQNF